MKIKTDFGEISVPKSIEKRFREYCKKDGLEPGNSDLKDFLINELGRLDGKLAPEDEAKFIAAQYTMHVPAEGGYPVEGQISFTDRGTKYTTLVFGWTSELDEKGPVHMVVYKEKASGRRTK
jgi:hypothetical protein